MEKTSEQKWEEWACENVRQHDKKDGNMFDDDWISGVTMGVEANRLKGYDETKPEFV